MENLIDGASGVAIPPVVARILSGNSTSPLTREARVTVRGKGIVQFWKGWCGARVANDKKIKKAVTAYHCNRFY